MAAPTNTMVTVGPGVSHEREDLADVIAQIDPEETPFYSNMTKGNATAILHEFTVQELVAQNTANKAPEGNDPDATAAKRPDRYNNYCQILEQSVTVSETQSAVDTLGAQREFARQKIMKAVEQRRDLNGIMTLNAAKDGVDPRGMAGLPTWITNTSLGATGTNPTGDGSDTVAPGTGRPFDDITYVDDVMQQCFDQGGQPEIMYMGSKQKRAFSRIPSASLATNQYNQTSVEDMAFIGSASMYLTDFGLLEVAVDRFLAQVGTDLDAVYLIDPRHIEVATLPGRNFRSIDLGKTGDNDSALVNTEATLAPTAPKAHGAIYALS